MFFSDANAAETNTAPGISTPGATTSTGIPAGNEQIAEPSIVTSVLMPILPIILVIYFLIIRPQQKKMSEHDKLVKGLARGDKIVTAGGVVGVIHKVDDDIIVLEIAPDVRIRVVRDTISHIVSKVGVANDNKSDGK
jgi:preprotein translocase subunit YajC